MRKNKYKLYWHGVNWYTSENDKHWRADGRRNYRWHIQYLERERMRNNISAWMLLNPLVLK